MSPSAPNNACPCPECEAGFASSAGSSATSFSPRTPTSAPLRNTGFNLLAAPDAWSYKSAKTRSQRSQHSLHSAQTLPTVDEDSDSNSRPPTFRFLWGLSTLYYLVFPGECFPVSGLPTSICVLPMSSHREPPFDISLFPPYAAFPRYRPLLPQDPHRRRLSLYPATPTVLPCLQTSPSRHERIDGHLFAALSSPTLLIAASRTIVCLLLLLPHRRTDRRAEVCWYAPRCACLSPISSPPFPFSTSPHCTALHSLPKALWRSC
ncbi:hypothetical protein C8Q79DRAFT_651533 [Trametes meyenii]|nr:hypothetical protein C8Q79DRAFT_651533 [Trametes meyenii]